MGGGFVKALLVGLAVLPAVALAAIMVRPANTPPIAGRGGVATLERITLGGAPQWVLIRGRDRSKPVVLFLHGGPGIPLMPLAHAFQRPLERDFVVVQWDRRGAGKTFATERAPRDLRFSRELTDAGELVEVLQRRFGRRPVIIVGHSWGAYLGAALTRTRPDLVRAFVGVGIPGCTASERIALQTAWARREALAAGDRELVEKIDTGRPWDRQAALFRFGGAIAGASGARVLRAVNMEAPEYRRSDVSAIADGAAFSLSHMVDDGPRALLTAPAVYLPRPVWLFTGRLDQQVPAACSEQFYQGLRAPVKRMVWFEHSAHHPFLEEPERFRDELLKVDAETRPTGSR
jgi:pimeloyl-ACP methyl ester carboxylesterase